MTAEQYLLDTLDYYCPDPVNRRCYENHRTCTYSPVTTGKMGLSEGCAIGRKLDPQKALAIDKQYPEGISISALLVHNFVYLGKWTKDLHPSFLKDIQRLHDSALNWESKGLSFSGKEHLKDIISSHGLSPQVFEKYL